MKVLAADPRNIVLGLVRNTKAAKDLLVADRIDSSNVHILQGDIINLSDLKKAAVEASTILGDVGLDVLINNAAYVSEATVLRTLADE